MMMKLSLSTFLVGIQYIVLATAVSVDYWPARKFHFGGDARRDPFIVHSKITRVEHVGLFLF
jgi:hypothetical protein